LLACITPQTKNAEIPRLAGGRLDESFNSGVCAAPQIVVAVAPISD
jgi:hypothetical protein